MSKHTVKTVLALQALLLVLSLATARVHAEPVTLNLDNADIGTLINTVSEVTGTNFVVDPRVKGSVSVVSSTPMEKEELYQVFLSILEVHGFAAIPSGNVVKIVPDTNAKQSGSPLSEALPAGEGELIVTRVLPIRHVSAAQLVPVLRPLVPQQGHLAAYAATNVLIVSDRAGNIERLVKIVARIDRPSESDYEVIRLEHAVASEVVRVVGSLTGPGQQGRGDVGQAAPALVADDRTNSILMSGDEASRLRIRALVSHLDTPLESTGNTHVVYLRYAKAADLAAVLTEVSDDIRQERQAANQGGRQGSVAGENVGIRADEASNALVITAPQDTFESLRGVITQLDIRRAQVLVEAILADVSTTNAAEFGIQWNEGLGGSDGNFVSAVLPGTNENISDTEIDGPRGLGFTYGLVKSGNLRALVRALATNSAANLISTPTLVTLDNEEAEIVVGDNVPFVTGSFTSDVTTPDNPFQTIERQDVGVVLRVTPQINEGNAVLLNIEQEVSNVTTTEGAADLTTRKRSIKTKLLVDDRQIVVLGGLIRDEMSTSVQKVPLLGDLPVVGALFKNRSVDTEKRNLMVFLKPTIVRNNADISAITGSKYSYMRARQLEQPPARTPVTAPRQPPLLPPFPSQAPEAPATEETAPADEPTPGSYLDGY